MSDHSPKHEEVRVHETSTREEISVSENGPKLTPRIVGLIIISLIILLVAGFLIWRKPFSGFSGAGDKVTDTIDSIRNAFRDGNESGTSTQPSNLAIGPNPADNASTTVMGDILDATSTIASPGPFASGEASPGVAQNPFASPAAPSADSQPDAGSSTGNSTGTIRGGGSGSIAGANTANQPAAVEDTVYRNTNLGFEFKLPTGWSSQVQDLGRRVIFFNTGGSQSGYMEVYDNISGVTLNDLFATLQGSPDVSQITQTTVSNIPAIRYTGQSRGIALVHNNKIYYLHSQLSDPTATSNLKFFN